MGLRISWVAVQGVTAEQALEALDMHVTGTVTYEDIDWRDNFALGSLPNGWLLALSGDSADAFEGRLEPLTKLGRAVGGEMSETVMRSEARGYDQGTEVWSVTHDPEEEESLYALDITGSPPPELDAIVHALRAEQDAQGGEDAAVDLMFGIPGRLSAALCGYMPDENELDDIDVSELRPNRGAKPAAGQAKAGFFARLFGRT